jgi:antitoxin (DNA-binding transcriptional repressor) of toxin-antitoxin stability system
VNVNPIEAPHQPMVGACRNEMPVARADAKNPSVRIHDGLRSTAMVYHLHGGPPVPKTVSKPEFARRALAYLREVEQTGEPPILTDRGRAVLRVVPQATAHDVLATLHGCVVRYDDPTEPVAIEAWGAGA